MVTLQSGVYQGRIVYFTKTRGNDDSVVCARAFNDEFGDNHDCMTMDKKDIHSIAYPSYFPGQLAMLATNDRVALGEYMPDTSCLNNDDINVRFQNGEVERLPVDQIMYTL